MRQAEDVGGLVGNLRGEEGGAFAVVVAEQHEGGALLSHELADVVRAGHTAVFGRRIP